MTLELTVPPGEVTITVPAGETVILHGRSEEAATASAYQWVPNAHGFPTLERSPASENDTYGVYSVDTPAVVIDGQGTFVGKLSKESILEALAS